MTSTEPVLPIPPRSGARLLADQLVLQGTNHVYCVPGESFVAFLDAALDAPVLRVVTNRHESASAFMAAAQARLTGQPGVAYVTRGPGACNAAAGLHMARQDSLPLVLLVGLGRTALRGREGFQEFEFESFFHPLAKWVFRADRAERLPEWIARAFQVAASGRPGPVVLGIPEDLLEARVTVGDARCHQPVQGAPSDTQMAGLRRSLGRSRRPLVVLGGNGWNSGAAENLRLFAEANRLPVACAFRHQDLFDNRHPLYAGDLGLGMRPALAQALQEADWLLALGTRLEEITTAGYALLDAPAPQPVLVHVHPDPDELGAVFQPELAIAAGMPQLCARLAMMAPIEDPPWQAHAQELCAGLARWRLRPAGLPASLDPDLWQIMADLRAALPPETIVCNGAGNFAGWLHRFFPFAQLGTQLAPASGSMGYAVPAAIAAKLNAPERPVICVSGDGDFLMSAQELATAVQLGAGVVFLVMDNGMYGSIRAHQEARHPGRVSATTLANPDFADFARSFGAHGATVRHSAEFPAALAEALASARARRRPALIHICCDPLQVSPTVRLAGVK